MPSRVFLIGVGYIGGQVFSDLSSEAGAKDKYTFTALTRSDDKVAEMKKLGIEGVKGTLDDHDLIKAEAAKADVIINTADCDHLPSTQATLDGISSRPDKSKPIIYIHTSGTGTLADGVNGAHPSDRIYSDVIPGDVDTLPDNAPHRHVDIVIKRFVESPSFPSLNARIAIIVPPLIHGLGKGPFNQISQQVPKLIRTALKRGRPAVVGQGKNIWSTVHVQDLGHVYLIAMKALERGEEGAGTKNPELYFFAETGEVTFGQLAEEVGKQLVRRGKLSGDIQTQAMSPEELIKEEKWPEKMIYQYGGNSRSKAERARKLGWKGRESTGRKTETALESIPIEIEEILKQE